MISVTHIELDPEQTCGEAEALQQLWVVEDEVYMEMMKTMNICLT